MNPSGLKGNFWFSGRHAEVSGYLGIFAFYALATALVSLSGDFPLNDDWTYGLGVKEFMDSGRVYLPGTCAAGIFHIIWGSLFCLIFGFSFETLRLASLVIMIFGACALYGGMRAISIRRLPALAATLVYAANPLMINITFSFMSDTTALSLTTVSLACYLKALRKQSLSWLAGAALSLAAAVSVRQTAIVLAPIFLLWPWCCSRRSLDRSNTDTAVSINASSWFAAAVACLIQAMAWIGSERWLAANSAVSPYMTSAFSYTRDLHLEFLKLCINRPGEQFLAIVSSAGQVLGYVGLALFPFWPGLCRSLWRPSPFWKHRPELNSASLSLIITALGAVLTVFRDHRLMPFSENIWRVTSVGALGLMGIANPAPTVRQKKFITTLAYISAWLVGKILFDCGGLLRTLLNGGARFGYSASVLGSLYLALFCTLAFACLETLVRSSDRYYLLFLAPLLMTLAFLQRWFKLRLSGPLTAIFLTGYIAYSLFAAQDYLSGNRARWKALTNLESSGVSYHSIDGGAEYDILRDWTIYGSSFRGAAPRSEWRWWPINGEEYIVSFSPVPEYETLSTEEYFSLLTMSKHCIYVLKKPASSGGR